MPSDSHAQAGDASLPARLALGFGATVLFLVLLELGSCGFERIWQPEPALLRVKRSKYTEIPEPIPGAFRIYLYGGSTVAGAPVEELAFPAQLEFWLKRLMPERPVQIVNFGVNGRASDFVRWEVERSLESPPDLAIVLTAHNEFLRAWEPAGRIERLRQRVGRAIGRTALVRTLRRLGRNLARFVPQITPLKLPARVAPAEARTKLREERVEGYLQNTRDVVERTTAAGVPLILATGPANLADWPPVHRFLHDDAYERGVASLREQIRRGELDAARTALEDARARYPSDAMLTWLEGRIAVAVGDVDRAAALFDAARDADPIPWRALGRFNDHLRELARKPGVHLADVDRAFRHQAEGGLVGWELVADNCHPTPFGGALLARVLLQTMTEEGLLLRDLSELPPLGLQWQVFRDSVLGEHPELWTEYLLTNARYVMKEPFFYFEAAHRYLEQARSQAPEDWRIPANLGTLAVLEGRPEEGRRALAQAERLHGEPLRAGDRDDAPYLREAQAILSGEIEALAPREPERPSQDRAGPTG